MTFYLNIVWFSSIGESIHSDGILTDKGARAFLILKPDYFTDPIKIKKWSGQTLEWLCIECVIYFLNFSGMLFLMVESRFMNIGVD